MALDHAQADWDAWLAEARRAVIHAAEQYVYVLRHGWITEEHTDQLTEAVDTLNLLSHQYLHDGVASDPTGRATAESPA